MKTIVDSAPAINALLQQTGMWRASSIDTAFRQGIPTGFPLLDQQLAGGGWPADGVMELLHDHAGIGEFRLLSPALARLSQTEARWILWVSPPHIPYAPALAQTGIDLSRVLVVNPKNPADSLWVLEKALSSQSCSVVLAWPGQMREKELRRLQVASKDGRSLGILFRPGQVARQPSPAELRLQLFGVPAATLSGQETLRLRILKRRGGWATDILSINL